MAAADVVDEEAAVRRRRRKRSHTNDYTKPYATTLPHHSIEQHTHETKSIKSILSMYDT